MKTTFALSICFLLAIMAASVAPAYLPTDETPYQTAIRQSPANPHDKSLSPGDVEKKLYVPSCTIDSSLSGKPPMDRQSTGDPSATGKSKSDILPEAAEIGSFRCQA